MSKSKYSDFDELEGLMQRIDTAVRLADTDNKLYSHQRILKAGAYKQMDYLIRETPKGRDRSNWYDWEFRPEGIGSEHSAHYFLPGRSHKAGTLARGWVMDMPEFVSSSKPTKDMGRQKVDATPIEKEGNGDMSMSFHNTAPFAGVVEYGHMVRMPYFFDGSAPGEGRITGYVPGKWYTMKAIYHGKKDIQKAIGNETVRQLRQVVRNK